MFGPIPSCYEDAGPEDRKILQMRDDEGRGWSDISEVIGWTTGTKVRSTSLLNRYKKMKLNFVVFEDKDVRFIATCPRYDWTGLDWTLLMTGYRLTSCFNARKTSRTGSRLTSGSISQTASRRRLVSSTRRLLSRRSSRKS